MDEHGALKSIVSRFLAAWLGVRQLVQASNFNRFQKAGLSATQFMTLNSIPETASGMTLSELAHRLNLSPATVAKTIDSLEARGLLTRTRSSRDRRQVLLTLTEEGMNFQNAASAEFHSRMTALIEEMPPDRREGLVLGLEAMLEAANQSTSAGGADRERRSSPRSQKE
jgi:DNA-binding MarR family transcriptional regulator